MAAITEVRVSIEIEAPVETAYALISDPENHCRWSPEATGVRRLTGSGPWRVGDTFTGKSRQRLSWSTKCQVTKSSQADGFYFAVTMGPLPVATWGYEVAESNGSCVVTEVWKDQRTFLSRVILRPIPVLLGRGWDAAEHNRRSMQHTLGELKEEAERLAAARTVPGQKQAAGE